MCETAVRSPLTSGVHCDVLVHWLGPRRSDAQSLDSLGHPDLWWRSGPPTDNFLPALVTCTYVYKPWPCPITLNHSITLHGVIFTPKSLFSLIVSKNSNQTDSGITIVLLIGVTSWGVLGFIFRDFGAKSGRSIRVSFMFGGKVASYNTYSAANLYK